MPYKLLIFKDNEKKNGVPYVKKIVRINLMMMCWILVSLWGSLCLQSAMAETDYFPGLRRPPSMQNWLQTSPEKGTYLLAQLSNIIEEQARRRFQQQFQALQAHQHQRGPQVSPDTVPNSGFTYHFPVKSMPSIDEDISFAVSPADPRYYDQSTPGDISKTLPLSNEEYEELAGKEEDFLVKADDSDGVPYFKVKSPMNVNPKLNTDINNYVGYPGSSKSHDVMTREELQKEFAKLQQQQESQKARETLHRSDVIQKPMDIDNVMGMYVIALVAGISAAVTVGLIALGIAWYTLHKKAKAAADIEYPAYGVTGPNKDLSPSGDRRLAQSAQMYHYQHQKQQIIAMENRQTGERNGSLSDVESDDENEEGDYTVYECPGLAPTGEMEVKNPLFLDDPTPATPAAQQKQQQQQQPQIKSSTKTSPPLSPPKQQPTVPPPQPPSQQQKSNINSSKNVEKKK